jgi:galactose mutarotase-like enzyme
VVIAIADEGLRAEISPAGAELVRLQDRQGRELLWDGDPAFWTGRSPLLFPIVGRVRDDRIRVGGAEYPLEKHGFARTSQFEILETSEAQCRFRLRSDEPTLAHYPFPFSLDVAYAVSGDRLTMTASVTNTGARPLPFSFGFHPAFRWPLPYGAPRDAHAIRFERDEPAPIRRVVDGLLSPQSWPSPVHDRTLVLRDALFRADALIFDRPESRALTYGAPGGGSIRVAFPAMPHLGIWTKPGAGYICIEPWQGFASPEAFDGPFEEKPGLVHLPPGESRDFSMDVTAAPA